MEDGNDKLKLLVLLCGEDDDELQIASAGALAMLTAAQKKLCTKMTMVVRTTVSPNPAEYMEEESCNYLFLYILLLHSSLNSVIKNFHPTEKMPQTSPGYFCLRC